MRRATGLVCAVVGIALAIPATALAHGRLKRSVPAAGAHLTVAPTQLRLEFTEPAEMTFTTVRLLAADGREIALGALAFVTNSRRAVVAPVTGTLGAGTWTVLWQTAGADGHPVRGRFTFVLTPEHSMEGMAPAPAAGGSIPGDTAAAAPMGEMHHDPATMPQGNGFGAESPLFVVVRWLQFVALLVVVGAVAFYHFVLARMRRASGAGTQDATAMLADADRSSAGLGMAATVALAVTLILRLVAQSVAMHDGARSMDLALMSQMVLTTTWGAGWMMQAACVVLAIAGFHGARRGGGPRWWGLAAIGAIACAWSLAFSGHAASAPHWRALAIVSDGLHVIGASSWLGTLTVLLVAGVGAAWRQAPEARGMLVRSLLTAFSPVALTSAAVAAATGIVAAWLHVGTIPALWGTRYGVILLIKLGVLAAVVLTGFYNWRVVQPSLGTVAAVPRLQRSARAEVAIAVLVLLVTAVLVATPTSMDATM